MTAERSRVVIVTGMMAAGKSTVAQALAESLPQSVHVRGDTFRKWIVNGRAEPTSDPATEGLQQLALRYRLACDVCASYARAGFTVIYQDVILGPYLSEVCTRLGEWGPDVVMLCPNVETVARREAARSKSAYGGDWTIERLARVLDGTPRLGLWLDTSELTVSESVHAIREHLAAPAPLL